MKKLIASLLVCSMLAFAGFGCTGGDKDKGKDKDKTDKKEDKKS